MLPLFFWCVVGVAIHFIFSFVQSVLAATKFNFKGEGILAVSLIILGAVGAYFAAQANLAGWFLKALFCVIGFLLQFAFAKLITIKP